MSENKTRKDNIMSTIVEARITITNPTFPYRVDLGNGYKLDVIARDEYSFPNNWFRFRPIIIDSRGNAVENLHGVIISPELLSMRSMKRIAIQIDPQGHLYIHDSLYVGDYLFSADFVDRD